MIVFHEGLPRSGKSYEAISRRIVPALRDGRGITAYIDGINHAKLAALAEIPEERCRELLQVITAEQAPNWHEHARKNDLVILDEIQDYHGVRSKLNAEQTKAITQHGHLGQDIVLMGQDAKDANVIWRRRIEIKLAFLKLTGIGQENAYSVTTWRHKGGDEYVKVGTQVRKYDTKFFGSYASHVSNDVQTGNYKDDRANAFKSPLIRYGIPAAVLVGLWGLWTAWNFFHPATAAKTASNATPSASSPKPAATPATAASSPVPAKPDDRSPQERLLAGLSEKYRIRLAGMIVSGSRVQGVVEWVDAGVRIAHRMTLDDLRNLGAAIVVTGDQAVQVQVGQWRDIATAWPMDDPLARASQSQLAAMRPPEPSAPPQGPSMASLGGGSPAQPRRDPEPAGDLNVRPTRTATAPPKS